jgi:hypothetical protein
MPGKKKGKRNGGRVRKNQSRAVIPRGIITNKPFPHYYYDTVFGPTTSTTTTGFVNLTPIPQGFGQSNRIADTIYVNRVELRLNVTAANADVSSRMRLTFYFWFQNTASVTPGVTSVTEDSTTYGIDSPYNWEGRKFYKVIYDKIFNLTGATNAPTVNSQVQVNRTIWSGRQLVQFNDGGLTTGTGHLYVQNYSDSAISPHPTYSHVIRVWYSY